MEQCKVSTNEGHHLKVVLSGKTVISQSTFQHLWNGLEVSSNDVEILDVDIKHSHGAGILVTEGYHPTISGGDISFGVFIGAEPLNSTIAPPIAGFSYTPINPVSGEEVKFIDETIKTHPDMDLIWHWDFGDGTTSDVQNPKKVFSSGVYVVRLIVLGEIRGLMVGGATIATKIISVGSLESPTAGFTIDHPGIPEDGEFITTRNPKTFDNIYFKDHSIPAVGDDSYLVQWNWDLGDGTNIARTEGTTVVHSYEKAGTYTISLTVTDSEGRSDTVEKTLTVDNSPPVAKFSFLPEEPEVGQMVTFECESYDCVNH